MKKKIEKHSL